MADAEQAQQAALRARSLVAPALVNALCRGQRDEVTEAVGLLFDYIDALAVPLPAPVIGESEAAALFKTFVRDNSKALRLVAGWGDGECGWLHEVLLNELQGKSLFTGAVPGFADDSDATAGRPLANGGATVGQQLAPLFPEDGGEGS